jgi:hypothetical protein
MTRPLNQLEGLSDPDAKVLKDIRQFGWRTVGVFPENREEGGDWAFSIGLYLSYKHPEVMIAGLPLKRCTSIVNVIGGHVKSGTIYTPGRTYKEILADPFRCGFRAIQPKHFCNYLGYALWFYEQDSFPVLQCFWPDKTGKLPWNKDCNEFVRKSQPLLYRT